MTTRIANLPARYPELGRIRLGSKGPKGEPRKGKTLRFSSDDEVVLKELARQLGGEVTPWDDDKAEQAWHLTTESASVPVLLPPDPIDTTYEKWGSGGIAKRCDGERCIMPMPSTDGGHMVESDCACLADGLVPGDRDDQKRGACQVTVRLRLIIPSVPGLGAWLCTSHSIYAAMELPGQVELLQAMSGSGRLVPADFAIEPRTEKKPWEKYKRDYIVPVLRVRASLAQLMSGEPVAGELSAPSATVDAMPALPASSAIDCPEACGLTHTKDAIRVHLVSDHGWTQHDDGRVSRPQLPQQGRSDDDATAEGDAARPAESSDGSPGHDRGRDASEPSPTTARAGKGEGPAAGAAPRTSRPTSPAPVPPHPPADNGPTGSTGAGPPAPLGTREEAAAEGAHPPAAASPGDGVSEKQVRLMHVLLGKLNVGEADKHRYCCDLIGIPVVESLNDLTKRDARVLIDALQAEAGEPAK